MSAFVDEYLPPKIAGYGWVSSPRWSSTITQVASGSERRNQNWRMPLHRFDAPEGIRCWEDVAALHDMWMALAGPIYTFPLRDPLDFASTRITAPNVAPLIGPTDSVLGVGDGVNRDFQLVKRYVFASRTFVRDVYKPVVSSVVVAMDALPPDTPDGPGGLDGGPYTWEVDRETGIVTFDHAPEEGVVVTAGFLFDVEVRFESDDSYEGIVHAIRTAGFADLTFIEVRPC